MNIIGQLKNNNIQILKLNFAIFLQAVLLLAPIMLLFYQENGLSVGEIFLFQSIFYLTSIIIEIPVGYLADSISKRNVLIFSCAIFLAITFMWLFFKGYWVILLGEILYAISKVMRDNASSGYLYDYLKNENQQNKMTKQYGYLNFYLALGTTVSALIGTYIYVNYGSKTILSIEVIIISASLLLLFSMPQNIQNNIKQVDGIRNRIKDFFNTAKVIFKNNSIMNYVFYSGLLTSFSILFALSFQPLMQNALFPIALFGIAGFMNHGTRAGISITAGKISKLFSIRKMIIPLFILYILAFICIFILLKVKNIPIIISLIFIICLIIGCQLLFTIRHISRLHEFVPSENRGNLISINNFCSRTLSFIILLSSKLLIDKVGFENFYTTSFIIFLIVGFITMLKTYNIKEKI